MTYLHVFLSKRDFTPKEYWLAIKPISCEIENDNVFIIVDHMIEDNLFTNDYGILCYYYNHTNGFSIRSNSILRHKLHVL